MVSNRRLTAGCRHFVGPVWLLVSRDHVVFSLLAGISDVLTASVVGMLAARIVGSHLTCIVGSLLAYILDILPVSIFDILMPSSSRLGLLNYQIESTWLCQTSKTVLTAVLAPLESAWP